MKPSYFKIPLRWKPLGISLVLACSGTAHAATMLPCRTVGGAEFPLNATSSLGLPIELTLDPKSEGICELNGNKVKPVGIGTCIIHAYQPGNATTNPAQAEYQIEIKERTVPPTCALVEGKKPEVRFVAYYSPKDSAFAEEGVFSGPLQYAVEQFGKKGPKKLDFPFQVRYQAGRELPENTLVTFTLSGGDVTWGTPLSAANLTVSKADGTKVNVEKGEISDNSVTYSIMAPLTADDAVDFSFKLGNVQQTLQFPRRDVAITATVTDENGQQIAPTLSTVLATAVETVSVDFGFSAEDNQQPAFISIAGDWKTFEGPGSFSDKSVSYGHLRLTETAKGLAAATTCPADNSTCQPTLWSAKENVSAGTLVIVDGNFNASGEASDTNVYVVKDDASGKIAASEFSPDKSSAKWTMITSELISDESSVKWNIISTDDKSALQQLFTKGNIILTVKGDDEIIENRYVPPGGKFTLSFSSGYSVSRSATLRHLKRNGTVCTLYNIPPSNGLDIVNIRITNQSPTVEGFVKGTLRDQDGKEIFSGKTLIEQGNLKPHQTVSLTLADLTSNREEWKGRVILTLESNVPYPELQIFGLLRAKETGDSPETPWMNMSRGASGQPCGE